MTSLDPELLLAHGDWLRRLSRQLAGDPHLADDVVQDAWTQALEQPPRLAAAPGGLRAWLATVVRNSVRMHRRSARRRVAREALAAVARENAAPSGAERLAGQQRLLAAVQALPAADRDVLLLRYFDELPPRAIAQRLGTTSGAVRSRLSRALATLRSRLSPTDDPRALAFALLPVLGHRGAATAPDILLSLLITGMAAKLTVFLGALGLGLAAWFLWPAAALPPSSPTTIADAAAPAPAAAPVATPATTSPAPTGAAAERLAAAGVPVEAPPAPAAAAPPSRFTVVGRCVDEQGRALPGARLVATNVRERPTALAAGDGRVVLELDWPLVVTEANPRWLMLEANADRRILLPRQERMPDARPETVALGDLVLGPGGALAGLVVEADGKPAAKAHVYLVRGALPASAETEERRRVTGAGFAGLEVGPRTATTDEAGRYRFEGVPATLVSVVAARHGRLCAYTPPVEVVAGGAVEAPLLALAAVPAANSITGVVRDADGTTLAGAEVSVFGNHKPRNVNPETRTITNAAGTFEVAVASGSSYSLAVKRAEDEQRELVRHDVAAGSRGVELVFAPARPLEVLVTGPDGAVLAAPVIEGIDEQNHGIVLRWRETEDGARRTTAPEHPFALMVRAPGHQQKRTERFDPAQLPPRITVTLARAATVEGRVLANGAAVAGAKVHAHRLDPERSALRFAGGLRTRLPGETSAVVTTDADGRFALSIARAGRYVVHAESAAFGRGESAVLDVAPDRAPPPITLELTAAAGIDGVVLVAEGDSREGLVVGATRGDGHVEVAVTGADGAFRFTGLAAGSWQVRVCRPDDQEWLRRARTWPERGDPALKADVELRAGETSSHRIDLAALFPAAVDGQLRLGGNAAANARISLWCDGEYRLARTDGEGRFQLRGQAVATTLHAFVSLPSGGELQVQHALQLTAGTNAVSLDAPVGAVDFTGLSETPPAEDDPRGGYALVWAHTPPAPRYVYRFEPGPDGVHRAATLPAGRAQLRRRDKARGTPDEWPLVAEVEVVAREHRVVTGK